MTVPFVKMHGAGNDFVMIDDRDEVFPVDDAAYIARLANRPEGIGCEGVVVVRRAADADFAMRFFNPDGSEAELCGNGARCVAVFARRIGAVTADVMRFSTRAGLVSAEILPDGNVRVAMPQPKDLRANFVNSGVPHAIVPVPRLDAVDVMGEGRRIRHSPDFAPAGTNVDFVVFAAPSALSLRTYERGVEAESGACGTGAVAAALIGVAQYGLSFPVVVTTVGGYRLVVDGAFRNGAFSGVSLTGPAKTIFSGEWEV